MPILRDKKSLIAHGMLVAVLLATCLVSALCGAVTVPLGEMWHSEIVRLRLERTAIAAIAGAALSVSGVIFQSLLRNPLAEPYVLGVSSGAGVGAVLAIVAGFTAAGAWTVPGMAFAGALAAILLVYSLARRPGGSAPAQTLLLSGVIVSAVLGSLLMFLISIAPADKVQNVVWWLLGSFQVVQLRLMELVAILVAAGVTVTVLFARDLNLMSLGEEPAAHLGLNVNRTRMIFFLLASLMTGATVAACGMIGFVGLIVPHLIRVTIGPDHRRLVSCSVLGGAAFLVAADSAARTILAPREVPIGVITALLGGPFFLMLLRGRKTTYWN